MSPGYRAADIRGPGIGPKLFLRGEPVCLGISLYGVKETTVEGRPDPKEPQSGLMQGGKYYGHQSDRCSSLQGCSPRKDDPQAQPAEEVGIIRQEAGSD